MFLYVTSDTLCTAAESAHVHTARKSPPVVSAKGLALAAARLPCISSSRQPCWRCRQVVAMLSQSHEVGISRISIHRWDGRSLLIPFLLDEWQGWHFLQWLLTMHDSSWLNGCLQILSGGSVWELPKNQHWSHSIWIIESISHIMHPLRQPATPTPVPRAAAAPGWTFSVLCLNSLFWHGFLPKKNFWFAAVIRFSS